MQKSRTQIYDELLVIKCQQGDKKAFNELKQLQLQVEELTDRQSAEN
jgi:hypothetical protein